MLPIGGVVMDARKPPLSPFGAVGQSPDGIANAVLSGEMHVDGLTPQDLRNLSEALKVMQRLVQSDPAQTLLPFSALWSRFAEHERHNIKDWTTEEGRAKHLLAYLDDPDQPERRNPSNHTPLMVKEYRAWRRGQRHADGKPYSAATRNRECALWRHVLNWAVDCQILQTNPIARIEMEPENNIRQTTLDESELQQLLRAIDEYECGNPNAESKIPAETMRAIILTLADTGMRITEVIRMRWDKFDAENGRVDLGVRDTKTKQRRRPKLSPRALAAVLVLPRHPTAPWIFCHIGGRRDGKPWSYVGVFKRFKRAVVDAGLQGVDGESIWVHTLRHSFVKNSRKRGIDPRVSMLMTGHRTMSAHLRYGQVDEDETDEAAEKIATAIARETAELARKHK